MRMEKHKVKGPYEAFVKRFLDILISFFVIVLFSWLYLILAIIVRFNLGSPVLFTQDRPGKNGKIFKMYKFRSMSDKRDENGNLLPDKQRLNKFGRILRSTSLDELPEFFNILKGDMSFVGPRPLLVKYLEHYNRFEMRRHEVRPGLTGLTQVKGRRGIPWKQKFEQDIEYVDNISFLMDLKIVFMTVKEVFTGAGVENFKENQLISEYFQEHGSLRAGEGSDTGEC
ncbi:MAG: sugar transferase [Oscillospiraceae bacterium]|nr:sugar transferase [Oscillospiraceae bacterium]